MDLPLKSITPYMNQPYYADTVDELCPSFKKLCIDKPVSEKWSIVQYRSNNVFENQCSNAIENALKHKTLKESQPDLIPLKVLMSNNMRKIVLTRIVDKPLTIVDIPKVTVESDNEEDMLVD